MHSQGTRYPRHIRRTHGGQSPIVYLEPPLVVDPATLLINDGGASLRNNEGSLLYRA